MATRFYFLPTDVPHISPAFDGTWNTAPTQRRWLTTSKTAATEGINGTVSGVSLETGGAVQLLSAPLAAQTISGTMDLVTRALEGAANDNINTAITVIKLVSNDGDTVRATLRTFGTGGGNSELALTAAGRSHLAAAGGNLPQSALLGDRILLEYGYGHASGVTGTTPQFTTTLGGNGTDHANSNGDTTGTVAWLEFSANLVFLTVPPPLRRAQLGALLQM